GRREHQPRAQNDRPEPISGEPDHPEDDASSAATRMWAETVRHTRVCAAGSCLYFISLLLTMESIPATLQPVAVCGHAPRWEPRPRASLPSPYLQTRKTPARRCSWTDTSEN